MILKRAPSFLAKPSEFKFLAKDLVRCNRPFNFNTIPIGLLQRQFGEFKSDCGKVPTMWAQELLLELTKAACNQYDNETSRRSAIDEVFKEAGLYLGAETTSTEYTTDGGSEVLAMPIVIRECKEEFGYAVPKAIVHYAQFLENQIAYFRYTRLPSVIMVDTGSSIGFYGCLWTGQNIHAEPLMAMYDLAAHWTDETGRHAFASSLDAFKNTVRRLTEYYDNPLLLQSRWIDRTFPYPTSYKDKTDRQINFTYQSRIDNMLVFFVSVDGSDGEILCVKFTRRYSEEAHQFLANLGYAPELRAVTLLPGNWIMVVMDRSQYVLLYDLLLPSYDSRNLVRSKIRHIVQKLHDADFVHGDVRDINILVDPKTLASKDGPAIHLIDFDWAGRDQEARYPMRINTTEVQRPEGVSDGKLITKAHDMTMVDWLLTIGGYHY